jgi:hypothetical protein
VVEENDVRSEFVCDREHLGDGDVDPSSQPGFGVESVRLVPPQQTVFNEALEGNPRPALLTYCALVRKIEQPKPLSRQRFEGAGQARVASARREVPRSNFAILSVGR